MPLAFLNRRYTDLITLGAWLIANNRADLAIKLPLSSLDGLSLQWMQEKNVGIALYAKDPQMVTLPGGAMRRWCPHS